jgi:predicted transcriptional regulator
MAATTTIRLPPPLRARLRALAKETDRSVHSLIVEGVERYAAYEEQMRRLVKDAIASEAQTQRLAEVYRADDVHAWIQRLAQGESAVRPKPWQR